MGGSALGGRISHSVLFDRLRVPFEIINGYKVPQHVGLKTLVICSSYSGNTEESIDCAYQSLEKGAKVFGITAGGKLESLFLENNLPFYLIDEKQNPSKQPRMSIGYATGSILGLFQNLGVASILNEEIEDAIAVMHETATDFHEHTPEGRNLAKKIFETVKNKAVILVSSEHLVGASHTIKNQFNENAKTFSVLFEIPELNHHLMEGLRYPKKLKEDVIFLFVNSKLYSDRVQKRYEVTKKVVDKNGYSFTEFVPNSTKHLSQAFELIILGSFLTYFLTEYYKIDPLEIPWVDFFKDEMKK
jgi:glucose/mannose-6-phosphate isomerase